METTAAVLRSLIVIKVMERFKWIKAIFYPTVLLKSVERKRAYDNKWDMPGIYMGRSFFAVILAVR